MHSSVLKHCLRWMAVFAFIFGSTSSAHAQNAIDVVVHYVEGKPAEGAPAHEVTAYVSVADAAGLPVFELQPTDFTLTEDSIEVPLLSLEPAYNDPLTLVLLLDTSGSMAGRGMEAAIASAANFLARLGPEDRVAVLTFDETIRVVTDFTSDHIAARASLQQVTATRGAGTCLYDAAYKAVEMSSTVPTGRRSIILFTDGVDEKPGGGVCSTHTLDDVVGLAREDGTRVPIFTLGMGNVDQDLLARLAQNTGGRSYFSPGADQLEEAFQQMAESIGSQFALRYRSTAGPGSHTLAVTVRALGAQGIGTRNFRLSSLPLILTITEPLEGALVSGVVTVRVDAVGQDPVQSITIHINGAPIASDNSAPYEIPVDFSPYPAGNLTIEAVAQSPAGLELARVSRTVQVGAPVPTATLAPAVTATPTPVTAVEGKKQLDIIVLVVGGLIGLFLLILLVALVVILRRRREQHQRDLEWARQVGGVGAPPEPPAPVILDRTLDAMEVSPDALGMFVVIQSDDPSMLGHRFEVLRSRTTFGRSADNDVPFPKDSPVSRHHALVEERNGGLWISEIESVEPSGNRKRPTYGTFVNDNPIGTEPVLLKSRDEVRLGKRVRMRFEPGQKLGKGEATTLDQFNFRDSEPTQEE